MKQSLYLRPWLDDVVDFIHAIELALSSKFGPCTYRRSLEETRNKLHHLCSQFEIDGEAENDEETYLGLFDGLTYLTDSLRQRPLIRGQLAQALAVLRKLRDERGTV